MYGPNGTNIDECGSNRANEYSPRDEVSEDVKRKAEYYEKLAEENAEPVRTVKHMVELQRVQLNWAPENV